jgi:hypothetical protein
MENPGGCNACRGLAKEGDGVIINDQNNERQTEPAQIGRHEIVRIAETISEIRPTTKAEHKGEIPETASKIVYRGSMGKYWILEVPYSKVLTPKLKNARINTVLAD